MENTESAKQQYYKELTWKEKRALRKEYNTINPRSKVWLAILVFAFIMAFAGLTLMGISLFSKENFLLELLGFMMYGFWIFIYGINLGLLTIRNKKFFEWLRFSKNILKNGYSALLLYVPISKIWYDFQVGKCYIEFAIGDTYEIGASEAEILELLNNKQPYHYFFKNQEKFKHVKQHPAFSFDTLFPEYNQQEIDKILKTKKLK